MVVDEEMDIEEEKAMFRAQFQKELNEIKNASDEDEFYDFNEEEMNQILDEVEETMFADDDEALAFFEKKYKEAKAVRSRPFKVRQRKPDDKPFYEKLLEHEMNPMESSYAEPRDRISMGKEDDARMIREKENTIGRYPQGWRHLENFVNFKLMFNEKTITEYTQELNRTIEFEEFLALTR